MTNKPPMNDFAFRWMARIHNNPLRRIFDDPIRTLKAAGVQPGQQVLEVGCGPGFFTLPAARLVGNSGLIHAIDLHPLAIKMVKAKLQKAGLTNAQVTLTDAAETKLPDDSIDLVLLFGVVHTLPLERVLPELYRVLKSGGFLAVQGPPGWSQRRITRGSLFAYIGREGRVSRFGKKAG